MSQLTIGMATTIVMVNTFSTTLHVDALIHLFQVMEPWDRHLRKVAVLCLSVYGHFIRIVTFKLLLILLSSSP